MMTLWPGRMSMLDLFLNIGRLYHWFIEMFNQIAFRNNFLNNKWKNCFCFNLKNFPLYNHWPLLTLSSVSEWFVTYNISVLYIKRIRPAMQSPTVLLVSFLPHRVLWLASCNWCPEFVPQFAACRLVHLQVYSC